MLAIYACLLLVIDLNIINFNIINASFNIILLIFF